MNKLPPMNLRVFQSRATFGIFLWLLIFSVAPAWIWAYPELTSEEVHFLEEKSGIYFISQKHYPPFEFISEEGEPPQGISIDLARWIAERYGFTPHFYYADFQTAQQRVLKGQSDVLTSLFLSEDRKKRFAFSPPFIDVPSSIFVSTERPDILSVEDLNGKRVAIQRGDYAKEFLAQQKIDYTIVETTNFRDSIQQVLSGEADVLIGDEQIVYYEVYSAGLTGQLKKVGKPLYTGQTCFAVAKDNIILNAILTKGVKAAQKEGVMDDIILKWAGKSLDLQHTTWERYLPAILSILIVSFIVSLLGWYWNRKLQELVHRKTQELQETQAQITRAEEFSLIMVTHISLDLHWLKFPPRLPNLLQTTEHTLSQTPVIDAIHPEDISSFQNQFQKLLTPPNEPITLEVRLLPEPDNVIFTEMNATLVKDKQNRPLYFLVYLRDITERIRAQEENRRLERQVLHSQKLESLGIMAGGIAHDFNNLLSGIIGYVDLAEMQLAENASPATSLQEIREIALRMAALSRQMLAYSGKGNFIIETADLNQVIRDSLSLLKISISKMVKLEVQLSDSPQWIHADISQIHQILLNLLTNASEALGSSPGIITIRTSSKFLEKEDLPNLPWSACLVSGNFHILEVEDNGCGMDEETQKRIFDPFFSTKFAGRGLGLAALQGIIRAHKGAVELQSEPGKGSLFRVFLPASPPPKKESLPQPDFPVPPKIPLPLHALIIEDEDIVKNFLLQSLKKRGITTLTADNGIDGLRLFQESHEEIHLILLDWTMPGLSGLDVLKEIRSTHPHIPIILMSGYSPDDFLQLPPELHPTRFLHKPFSAASLFTEIHLAISKS